MGVKFLSEEWAKEVQNALSSSDAVKSAAGSMTARIQQVVTTPDGEVKYWFKLEGGDVDLGIGEIDNPDATITQDYDTAVAITKAEINPQAAFMQGNLKVTGNMGKLLQHQMALQVLFPVLAGLSTEY